MTCVAAAGRENLGDPGRSRTCDLQFRKLSLYPAELCRLVAPIRSYLGERYLKSDGERRLATLSLVFEEAQVVILNPRIVGGIKWTWKNLFIFVKSINASICECYLQNIRKQFISNNKKWRVIIAMNIDWFKHLPKFEKHLNCSLEKLIVNHLLERVEFADQLRKHR